MPHRYAGRDDTDLAIVLDCSDLDRAAAFWCAALGYAEVTSTSGRYRSLLPAAGGGIELLLQVVPEAKARKNRMHLDLRTPDMEGEVRRLLGLGGRRVTDQPIDEEGWRWRVLQDPDGNELCVLQLPPPAGA